MCDAAITDDIIGAPTIMLKMPLAKPPRGSGIRLFGRSGPAGRVARIDRVEGGFAPFEAVAFFPAIKVRATILKMIADRDLDLSRITDAR